MAQRVKVEWTGLPGSPFLSTFIFGTTGSGGAADARAGVVAFMDALEPFYTSALTASLITEVQEFDVATGDVSSSFPIAPSTHVGTLAGSRLAPTTQGLIRLRTGTFVGGREVRGKVFVPGVGTSSALATGDPNTTYTNGLQAAAQALIDYSPAAWLVWSRASGTAPVVTSASVWNRFAVLRSRRD